jgi:hypothetical protein
MRATPWMVAVLFAGLLLPPAVAQPKPDAGPVMRILNKEAGQALPPAMRTLYSLAGQNISREDVRLFMDLDFTKGDVNALGLLIGSGKAEIQAHLHLRGELRVISSDRIRAALQGENAYNISADNATVLSQAYIPADVFRASLAAETVALFQHAEEQALAQYLARSVPEMDVLSVQIAWSNVTPVKALTDTDLKEPPIVIDLDLIVQYIRIESLQSLLGSYMGSKDAGTDEYTSHLKEQHGAPPRERDFLGAAAYTQMLNLSMQPGWSLDARLHVPRGYSFTYFNEPVLKKDRRSAAFEVDASTKDAQVQNVFLASITHRRAVALALFVALWATALIVGFPLRFAYSRYRLSKLPLDRPLPNLAPSRPRPVHVDTR